jgi:hypothetical protein
VEENMLNTMQIDQLLLNESYNFNVVVEDNKGERFAGKLALSQRECTLVVVGEVTKDRHPDFSLDGAKILVCSNGNATFILMNLKARAHFFGVLQRHPTSVNAFEMSYSIEYVIYSRSTISSSIKFAGIELQSSSLANWVGETTTQRQILSMFNSGTLFNGADQVPAEFEHSIPDVGTIAIGYAVSTYFSVMDLRTGFQFPPRMVFAFNELKGVDDTFLLLHMLLDMLSFLLGHKVSVQAIALSTSLDRERFKPTLYFSGAKTEKSEDSYAMFPLGHNNVRDDFGLPALPLESLNAYFNVNGQLPTYFKKYLRYRELENSEERFLGYFRLLEKLTFAQASYVDGERLAGLLDRAENFLTRYFKDRKGVTGLLKRIHRTNGSKLNAASCIREFMKLIPDELSGRWIFGSGDIDAICKHRNDLTHANEIEPNDQYIDVYAKFIEVLLVIALFNAIDMPPEFMVRVIPRMKGHDWIVRHESPVFETA